MTLADLFGGAFFRLFRQEIRLVTTAFVVVSSWHFATSYSSVSLNHKRLLMIAAQKTSLCVGYGRTVELRAAEDSKRRYDLVESRCVYPVVDHRSLSVCVQQARALKNRQVLGYCRLTDIEPQRKRSDAVRVRL